MATGTIKAKTNNPIKSKIVSTGVTISANAYATVLDATLANKNYQGISINGIASHTCYPTTCYISDAGFYVVLVNKGSAAITTGAITVYYTD